jgi:hypothetical protein
MPRSEQEAFNRYPEDLRTQLKQKKYAQERYEAQQVRFVRFIVGPVSNSPHSERNNRSKDQHEGFIIIFMKLITFVPMSHVELTGI